MTSHSKILSPTRPHDIPGRSFADCMYLSCRERRPAAPAELCAILTTGVDVEAGWNVVRGVCSRGVGVDGKRPEKTLRTNRRREGGRVNMTQKKEFRNNNWGGMGGRDGGTCVMAESARSRSSAEIKLT